MISLICLYKTIFGFINYNKDISSMVKNKIEMFLPRSSKYIKK